MTIKEFFDFVTDPTVKESNMDEYLQLAMDKACNRDEITETEKVDDQVRINVYLNFYEGYVVNA